MRMTAAIRCATVVWFGLYGLSLSGCSGGATAAKPAAVPRVITATPVKMPIVEWDEYIGRLSAIDMVEVRARVSGYLATTSFEEGQIVKAGDLLAVIDQRPFIAEVRRGEANQAAAQAELGKAQSAVTQAQSEKTRSDVRLDLAGKMLKRTEQLREKKAITDEEFEIRQAEYDEAVSEVAVANAQIESAQSAVIAAEASVGVARSNLELAQLNLQYTRILAPISGRISYRYVTEGNLVSGGTNDATLLTTIVSVDPIHCDFDVDEQAFLKYTRLSRDGVSAGNRDVKNPVYLALADEQDGYPHWGHTDFSENRFDEETGTLRGRAILANPDHQLTPGLFTRVRIPGSPRYDAVLIPDRAVATDQAEKFVYVVGAENKIERRVVELGPLSHGLRIVRSGLNGSEQLVLSGQQRVRPGVAVEVSNETIVASNENLPDTYEPVPRDRWLTPERSVAANVEAPPPPPNPMSSATGPGSGGELLP